MTAEELAEARANVIERAIHIESMLDAIISQHYLSHVSQKFLFEVLYDEWFSFGFKVKIFSKITSEQSWVHKLNRLSNIRNYFAHRGRLMFSGDSEPFVPDPKDPAKSIDFDRLYSEFSKLDDALEPFLLEHFERAGGRFTDDQRVAGGKVIHYRRV